jgi:hypothetical protein
VDIPEISCLASSPGRTSRADDVWISREETALRVRAVATRLGMSSLARDA